MSEADGYTHEEFLAVSGLAPIPAVPPTSRPLPVCFSRALDLLKECQTIDEARLWDHASDALAAWAKIYTDDAAGREARSLKLHAYRRIGVLAAKVLPERTSMAGRLPGARSVLLQHGFSNHQAAAVSALAKVSAADFRKLADSHSPPSPLTLAATALRPHALFADYSRRAGSLLSILKNLDQKDFTQDLGEKQIERVDHVSGELISALMRLRAALRRKKAA